MSKGSTPRPFNVTNEEYANRWDAIFGKDEKENKEKDLGIGQPHNSRNSGGSSNSQGASGQAQND